MARIKHQSRNLERYLRGHHVFGRDTHYADITLGDAHCSRVHAVVEWDGKHWTLKDVSRNGTWLNERPLESNLPAVLDVGSLVRFGSPSADAWRVTDLAPPADLLVGETADAETVSLEDYLLVPEESNAYTLIHDSGRGGWLLYSADAAEELGGPYAHGNEIVLGNHRWRIFQADTHSPTVNQHLPFAAQPALHLVARLSGDEESTELTAVYGADSYELGDRAHHYLIAHLARLKAHDLSTGNDPLIAGWVEKDRLSRDLGLSATHLNLHIHRAEKHLHQKLHVDAGIARGLFDKQRGRLRLGAASCEVYKGSQLVAQLNAA